MRQLVLLAVLIALSGCEGLKPSVKANLPVGGNTYSYTFTGTLEGPKTFNNYYAKKGYRFYSVFISVSNMTTNDGYIGLNNYRIYDEDRIAHYPEFVDTAAEVITSPSYHKKSLDALKAAPLTFIFVLPEGIKPVKVALPNEVQIELP